MDTLLRRWTVVGFGAGCRESMLFVGAGAVVVFVVVALKYIAHAAIAVVKVLSKETTDSPR